MRTGPVLLATFALLVGGCSAAPDEDRSAPVVEGDAVPAASTGTPPMAVVLSPAATSASQVVTWRSVKAWGNQRVVAQPVGGGTQVRATARRKAATSVRDSGSARPAYMATLTGLEPGTRYRYRVVNNGGSAGDYHFTTPTAEPEPWTFLTLGDTQVANADRPAAIVKAAVKRFPRPTWSCMPATS